jgi:hypothetical protein
MQALAILLIEMVYENRDTKCTDPSMTEAIRKMIRWLRAMKFSDPVASRAYDVIWRILKGCAPALQSQANDLLASEYELDPEPHHYPGLRNAFDTQQTSQPPLGAFYPNPMDTLGGFDARHVQQEQHINIPGFEQDMHTFFPPDQHLPTMSFAAPFFTSFDQGAPMVNMQDLWGHTGSSAFDPGFNDLNPEEDISQRQTGNPITYPPSQPPDPHHGPPA